MVRESKRAKQVYKEVILSYPENELLKNLVNIREIIN
jgi:hypothetical protein